MPKRKLTDSFIRHHENPNRRLEIYDAARGMDGLAIRITPKGNKSFIYRYRAGDNVRTLTIGRYPSISLEDARAEKKELYRKVQKGIDPMEEKKRNKMKRDAPEDKTFKELAEAFKSYHFPALREKTQSEYKRIIDNELVPAFGKYMAKDIQHEHIMDLLDEKAYKNEAPTMANRIRARLHKIYEFGIERRIVKMNPVSSVPRYAEAENKRERYYKEDEIRDLWAAFSQQQEPTRSIFKILLLTAQRSRETRHMKWENINNGIWTVPSNLSKSNRSHDVPLSSMALEILDQNRQETEGKGYVFPGRSGLPLVDMKRPKESVRTLSGVSDFRPHDLRRTAATMMAKLNVERTTLGKVLNHKGLAGDSQVTAIYDRHDYMDKKRTALEKWSRYLKEILDSEPGQKIIHKIG